MKRFSVNLTAKGVRALSGAQQIAEETQTEAMNRAIIWYEYTLRTVAEGGDVLVRYPGEDVLRPLHLF